MTLSLHGFSRMTAAAAFILLFAGGMVTSTGSGLAVPDWPLSYGQYFPAMVGGVIFEHGHRMIAGMVGLMTFCLSLWIWKSDSDPQIRRLAVAASLGILLQAFLGGITVLYLLPKQISIAHACLGQGVFCLLLAIAQTSSPWHKTSTPRFESGFWRPGFLLVTATFLQLFLGAVYRHTRVGLAWHLIGAVAVICALGWVCSRTFSRAPTESALLSTAWVLACALPAQLLLGLGAYLTGFKPIGERAWLALLPTAHLALGAMILGAGLLWTLRAKRLSLP